MAIQSSLRPNELEEVFDGIDEDGDGFICMYFDFFFRVGNYFCCFIVISTAAKTVHRIGAFHEMCSVDDRLMQAFDQLDLKGDGKLDEEELTLAVRALSPTIRHLVSIKAILKDSDINGDGFISVCVRLSCPCNTHILFFYVKREEFLQALHPHLTPDTTGQVKRPAMDVYSFFLLFLFKSKKCE